MMLWLLEEKMVKVVGNINHMEEIRSYQTSGIYEVTTKYQPK